MPIKVHGFNRKKFRIINKEKLNKIMIMKNIVYALFFIMFGILTIIIKSYILFMVNSLIYIFIGLLFTTEAKKYVNLKR